MNLAFSYDRKVSGRDFIGRRQECHRLARLLCEGQNVALYAPAKDGKSSLIEEVLANLKREGRQFQVCQLDAGKIIRIEDFFSQFGSALVKSLCTSTEQIQSLDTLLADTAYRYDAVQKRIQVIRPLCDKDYRVLFMLPEAFSEKAIVLVLKEFQHLEALDEFYPVLRVLRDVLIDLRQKHISYLFVGSQVNAMKELFVKSCFFGDDVQAMTLSRIPDEEIHNYIRSVLNVSGKVMERKDIMAAISLFEGNIWHIKHYMALCDSLTRGYINEMVMEKALSGLVASQLPYLNYVATHLTCFQLRFLKALIEEGKTCNFSSAKILEKYGLNSSANVVRVRQALMKKEIITMEGKAIYVIDPLFHYWLKKYFFQ